MAKFKIILISLLMASSYSFSSSMYAPALPDIQTALHTSEALAQQSLSVFFIALACSQLISGPLSERYGRRPVALMAAVVFVVGSLICMLAQNIDSLLLGRIVQGLGVGGLYLLCRTILQDSFNKSELMGILAWYGVIFMALPSLTPILGGYLTQHFNWEANFIFLLLLAACLLLVLVFFANETIDTINPNAIKPRQMAKDYVFIASNIKFLCYLAMMISGASCLLLFQVTGAFVAQNQFHISVADYGLGAMALTASTVTSRLFWNHFLKNSLTEHKTLFYGCIIQGTGAILITLSLVVQNYSLMLIGFSFMSFGSAFLIAIAGVSALYLFPDHKGQVGAIYGALQMVGAFGFTYILSLLPATQETIVICSWGVVLLSVVAFVVLLLRGRQSTRASEVLSN